MIKLKYEKQNQKHKLLEPIKLYKIKIYTIGIFGYFLKKRGRKKSCLAS